MNDYNNYRSSFFIGKSSFFRVEEYSPLFLAIFANVRRSILLLN